jgi:putative nucleotidyltransferase with HDIG domain
MLRTRVRTGTVAVLVISTVFAVLFTIVSSFDRMVDRWAPQIAAPTRVALRIPFHARITHTGEGDSSHMAYGQVRVIIPPYTVLDESVPNHREAFAYESLRRAPGVLPIAGMGFVYLTLALVFLAYLQRLGQNRLRLLRTQVGLFVLMLAVLVATKAMLLFTGLPELWAPVGVVPLWIALAFDRRSALLLNLVMAFLAASLLRFDLMFLTVVLVRGMVGILFVVNRRRPRSLILTGTLAGVASTLLYMALVYVLEGTFHPIADLMAPERSYLLASAGGGALAGLISSVLRDPVERLLGQVPREKLLDLTDIEHALLKKLANDAPGTWEHSRAMANLAEAAAAAIGADSLLTRVGAYYHDIGKTVQPKYFVENLAPDEPSPHDQLAPEVSADAIMAHVVLGTKILRDHGIPEPVVEFAYTHHGTQLVEYFWHKYKEQNTSPELAEDHFRYPGMKPQTKETAILMLVDSIEAASRTVSPPTAEKFEEMIRRILFTKLQAGELDQSGLTVEDLHIIVSRTTTALVNMFHGRIKYPWQRQSEPRPARSFTTPRPREVQALVPQPPEPPDEAPAPKPATRQVG